LDSSIEEQLGPKVKSSLDTIYLEGNPLQEAAGATYRLKVHLMLPQVKQIDASLVRASQANP
jgi:protein phosphatase 1 regulatory subunit 7